MDFVCETREKKCIFLEKWMNDNFTSSVQIRLYILFFEISDDKTDHVVGIVS